MSDRVERKILALLDERAQSPNGNPIPGLDELGVTAEREMRSVVIPLAELAGPEPCRVEVRRLGEPVQHDGEVLTLLQAAGAVPGRSVDVVVVDGRWRIGSGDAAVEVGKEIAGQVWVTVPRRHGDI